MSSLPTHIGGIPLWAILLGISGLIFFFLRMSGETANQDRYPTARLFLYIVIIFVAAVGVIDLIRWANLW